MAAKTSYYSNYCEKLHLEEANPEILWQNYHGNRTIENRNKLIEYYLHLLYKPVKSLYPMCKSTNQMNDIFQSAVIGLIEAVECYSPDKNASFKTFSRWRINGSIIDYLRKTGLISLPYNVRKKINEDRTKAENENSATDYQSPYAIMSLESVAENSENQDYIYNLMTDTGEYTENTVIEQVEREELYRALKKIPENEYITLVNYYFKDKTLDEIAQILNMTKAGVWQVRNRALGHMKNIMENG